MTDLELRRALAELSDLHSYGEPIVTLYLDTHWADEKQRERARVFVQEAIKLEVDRHAAHPQLEALRRTLGKVGQLASDHVNQATDTHDHGLAVLACEALGLWRVLSSPRSFRSELCVDGRPHLVQLARLADDVEPALVAFVHTKGMQLYQVALGAVVSETATAAALPIRQKQAAPGTGTGPHASERHVEELIERARRGAIEVFTQQFDKDPRQHVVLVGTSEQVAAFERQLPDRVRSRVLARLPRPPGREATGNGHHELVEQVVAKLAERERKAEAELVEHAVGEALRGGMAVLGPDDVVLAVNERRVHRLILEEDFERSGWRCRNCSALGMNHDEVCSFCQGPLARVSALGEELVGRVLAEDGEVEVVAHTNRLHSYAGVAALLRQGRAVGLSGQQRPGT
jgi:peptide subunit release factor 1 (eRF1)